MCYGREAVGLDIDPQIEQRFQSIYDEAMRYFKQGSLETAYKKFDAASSLVDWGTKLGGEAEYYKAVCLDSVGENMKAKPMYNRLSQ